MTGDKDNRNQNSCVRQLSLKVQTVGAAQSHIQHQATGPVRPDMAKEFLRRRERFASQSGRLHQPLDGRPNTGIVVNDEHCGSISGRHSLPSILVARVKQKVAPHGKLSVAHNRPPCDSIIERLIRRPMPVPWGLVVKNALKIWSACCGGRPTPVSLTDTIISAVSVVCDLTANSRTPSTSFIASIPLIIRFINTCCSSTRSPMTRGRTEASSVWMDTLAGIASVRRRTIVSRMISFTSITS